MRAGLILIALLATETLALGAGVSRQAPDRLFGVRVGMSDRDARAQLARLGSATDGADTRKQTWEIRDPRYRYLVVRLDDDWRVKWMTAFARPGGRRVRYRDVGDLARGHRHGFYSWVWTLPVAGEGDSIVISARGQDSTYLTTLSIERGQRSARVIPSGVDSTR